MTRSFSRIYLTLALLTSVALIGCSSNGAQTSEGQTPLFLTTYMQIKPGEVSAWEAARQRTIECRESENYPWTEFVSIGETNIARIVTRLPNGWSDMAARSEWFNARSGSCGSGMPDTVNGFWREINEPLPELAYQPDNPRFAQGEGMFTHQIKIYARLGTRQAARESMAGVSAALRAAGSDQPRFVGRTVVGSGPAYTVFYPALDAADYYEHREENRSVIQGALSGNSFSVRTERTNWQRRPDLGYSAGD